MCPLAEQRMLVTRRGHNFVWGLAPDMSTVERYKNRSKQAGPRHSCYIGKH